MLPPKVQHMIVLIDNCSSELKKKERTMKKGIFITLFVIMSMSAFASQMYVVGEVFSQTW